MKSNELNLSTLCFKKDEQNIDKYLDSLAAPYNLNVSKTRKKGIFAVDMYDGNLVKLFEDSAIKPYNIAWINELAKPVLIEKRDKGHTKEHAGDRIASVKFLQDSNLFELDIVSVEEPPVYAYLNLLSVRKVDEDEFIDELRERFEYRYEQNSAVMIDKKAVVLKRKYADNPFNYKNSFYPIPSETIEHMKKEKMNVDEMKEYLLKNRDWLKVVHDESATDVKFERSDGCISRVHLPKFQ